MNFLSIELLLGLPSYHRPTCLGMHVAAGRALRFYYSNLVAALYYVKGELLDISTEKVLAV